MELWVIDRFEEGFAVCEHSNGEMVLLNKAALPNGAKEGSVIKKENAVYVLDIDEEARRKERILTLENDLFV